MSNFLPWGILFAYLGGGPGKAYYIFEFSYFQGLGGGGVGSEPRPPLLIHACIFPLLTHCSFEDVYTKNAFFL